MELLEKVSDDKNLFEAYKHVYKNRGTIVKKKFYYWCIK